MTLNVNKDIEMITIISRADSPSYAIQHDFTIGQWIDIHLQDGTNLIGEITDLQEDQIEILKTRGFIKQDNVVVNTGSLPVQLHLPTNLLKITKVD
jgi:hypothetical protein